MPIYEYRCPSCGADFEKLQKISAPKPACPECGFDDVKKKVSASAFVLKGSGWYKDHYGLKKTPAGGDSGDATSSSDSSGSSSSSASSSSDTSSTSSKSSSAEA